MKLPDVYSDWRIAGGLALLILGASNWIVGLRETRQSSQVIAQTAHSIPGSDYRSFDELEAGAGAVLDPFTAQAKSLSYARARMDFYHVTFLSGQVLVIAGLLLTLAGFIAVIQIDSRRALTRIETSSSSMADGPGAGPHDS